MTLDLLSVDGTRMVLPNHSSVKEEFGECSFGPKADGKRSMVIGSMVMTKDILVGVF